MTENEYKLMYLIVIQAIWLIVMAISSFDSIHQDKMTAECYERKYGMINEKCHCSYCPNRFACQHYEYPKKSQWFRHLIQRFQKKPNRGQ